jgi:predicted O-methyltransferase YrrM
MTTSHLGIPTTTAAPSDADLHAAIDTLKRAGAARVQSLGWHFQANDFYSPLNDLAFLEANRDLWTNPVDPADVDMRLAHQEDVAREVSRYVPELRDIPATSDSVTTFYWDNNFWNSADAMVQYGLVRSRKPRKVIEVGCGWSSLLLAKAMIRNAQETGLPQGDVTQVEPYPRKDVMAALPRHWKMHECMLQRAPLDLFASLSDGDILFYDGSHCAKVASDVNWFFFRVLPVVRPGVLIHVHDIFFPYDYPEDWIFARGQTWNEQYLLQAFLMNNPRYQIEIANRYLWVKRRQLLEQSYGDVQPAWGCSLWMKKV